MPLVRKFAARTPAVRVAMSTSNPSRNSAGMPNAVIVPTPPASATATASSGLDTDPIGACWMGTSQPTSSVNGVRSIDLESTARSRGLTANA